MLASHTVLRRLHQPFEFVEIRPDRTLPDVKEGCCRLYRDTRDLVEYLIRDHLAKFIVYRLVIQFIFAPSFIRLRIVAFIASFPNLAAFSISVTENPFLAFAAQA